VFAEYRVLLASFFGVRRQIKHNKYPHRTVSVKHCIVLPTVI
jgi:hypothetical protein